jgi:hypothetical protein
MTSIIRTPAQHKIPPVGLGRDPGIPPGAGFVAWIDDHGSVALALGRRIEATLGTRDAHETVALHGGDETLRVPPGRVHETTEGALAALARDVKAEALGKIQRLFVELLGDLETIAACRADSRIESRLTIHRQEIRQEIGKRFDLIVDPEAFNRRVCEVRQVQRLIDTVKAIDESHGGRLKTLETGIDIIDRQLNVLIARLPKQKGKRNGRSKRSRKPARKN